jgi:capsular polysaccharide transport system permease protein
MDTPTALLRDTVDYVGHAPPPSHTAASRPRRWDGWAARAIARRRGFLAVVVAPTLVAALYLFGVAARQYESEAHFTVKTAAQSSSNYTTGLAQMFGVSGAMTPSQSESYSVGDYLTSHDAVTALRRRFDLVSMFHRPEADIASRLWDSHPAAEQLLKYYRRQVKVAYASETGITTLKVHAFRAADAQAIAEALLEMGEWRVNVLNQRALDNATRVAERQLNEAEVGLAASQGSMTHLRQSGRDIDPEHSSVADITMLAELRGQLAQSRAQLAAMGGAIQPDSPQYAAMADRVRALQTQMDAEAGKLAGAPDAASRNLSAFESLKLRQDFASKRYEAAATALESARSDALKQQLYVVRVVEPDRPEKALFPQRWLILASVFFAALLTYGVGALIVAGVREHSA